MRYDEVREELVRQWTYTGGPNEAKASEIDHDDGDPIRFVKIWQFRGDKVERETLYFADPFPAPDWRRPWAEEGQPEPRGDLPALIHGGN
jgi:hypothetical protein